KTDDGYFLGFPSCWNLVAFYLYVLQPLSPWLTLAALGVLAALTFVPARYLYPSQGGRLNQLTNGLAAVWALLVLAVLVQLPAEALGPDEAPARVARRLALLSLFFPVYYMGASWVVSVRLWRRRRRERLRAAVS